MTAPAEPRAVVLRSGPLTTVQDLGRRRGRRKGIAPGGAMDRQACLWANRLLENPPEAPVLEVTLGGAAVEFQDEATIALTGADCRASVGGTDVGTWRTVRMGPGEILKFGYSKSGQRAYIAFPGGLLAPREFGSASVVLRESLPGLLGRPIQPGDALRWGSTAAPPLPRTLSPDLIPQFGSEVTLGLVPGYEWHHFSQDDRNRIWSEEWTVADSSDRVACRLTGSVLGSGPKVLDSTPLVDGTVQVPGGGQPLVFMRDRPTIGGYPKLGAVDPGALDRLAQSPPGTRIRFVPADPKEVLARLRRRRAFFGLAQPSGGSPANT